MTYQITMIKPKTEAEFFERDVQRFMECLTWNAVGEIGGLTRASEEYNIHPANAHPSEMAAWKEAVKRLGN